MSQMQRFLTNFFLAGKETKQKTCKSSVSSKEAFPGAGDQSLMPSGMFDGIIFDQAEDDLPTTPAPRRTPPPLAGEQLPIDHQLGSLTTTIQKLQDDAAFYRAQVRLTC